MNKVSLALIAKIDQLYKSVSDGDNSFISYTALPTTYTSNNFVFLGSEGNGVNANAAVHNQWEFSHLTGVIPKVKLLWDSKVEHIWQVYKEVIDNALIAERQLSQAQEKALKDACEIRDTAGENYSKYQTDYFAKQLEINNLVIERNHDASTDREMEINIVLEFKNNELKQIEQNWIAHGKKETYENAIATISNLERNSISKWKYDIGTKLADHNKQSDPGTGNDFYPTYCVPSDFYREQGSGWAEITLNKSEVDTLYQYAKDGLFKDFHSILSNQYSELEIEKLSAKIAFITITRDWFDPRFLDSGLWKLPEYLKLLSDGGTPPKGELPAFIDKLIFIKDVDVELKQNSQVNKKTIEEHQKSKAPIMAGPLFLKIPTEISYNNVKKLKMQKKFNAVNAAQYTKFVDSYNKRVVQNPKLVKTMQKDRSVSAVTTLSARPVYVNVATKSVAPQARFVKSPQVLAMSVNKVQPISVARINPNIAGQISRQYGFKGTVRTDRPLNEIITITFMHGKNKSVRRTTKTDKNGNYSINLLPAPYYVEIKHPGFERYFRPIKYANKQGIVKLNINLKSTVAEEQPTDKVEQEIEGSYDGFILVGFVCRKFDKCPNPDEAVENWI